MDLLADRLNLIKPSPTVAMTQRAAELKAQGVDVLSFTAGEPDFDTPSHIVDAAKRALDNGMTRYTPSPGIPELRQAVADQSRAVRGVPCSADQVIITAGAKHALFQFFQAVLNPGDEVIIPAPYWVSYPDQVRLAGGVPVIAQTLPEDRFLLTPAQLERLKTPKTKVIVINTPNNPTGSIYPSKVLSELVDMATQAGIWVLCDEVYRDLVYGHKKHTSPMSIVDERFQNRVFIVDGVSKSYAMTGWRIGWGIGDPDIIKGMITIQSQSTTTTSAVAQSAALAALSGDTRFLRDWIKQYVKRRDVLTNGLSKIDGIECALPDGAFYVLPSVKDVLTRLNNDTTDVKLASTLLEEAKVAVVPGSAFGAPGHLRLSYATSLEVIEEALSRMKTCIESL